MRIPFKAGDAVASAIRRLGRTEDMRWSPSGRRLALAGYLTNRVLILEAVTETAAEPSRVELTGYLEIDSPSFNHPHGVAWLDEHTMVVASRYGTVGIFEVPVRWPASGRVTLEPVQTIGGDRLDLVKHPGSVSVFPAGLGLLELLVCSGLVNHVSRHLIDLRDAYAVLSSDSFAGNGVQLPDGVRHAHSGRWVAVSNHDARCVLIFRGDRISGDAAPDGVLRGIRRPHGLLFSPDDRWILVADADAPFVHVFNSQDGDWNGEREPVSSVQILDDATFERGHFHPGEGGPKGIDLTRDGALLAATCEEDPLVFFDMRPVLGTVAVDPDPVEPAAEVERARRYLLQYLGAARTRVDETTTAIRRISEREVQLVVATRWWRVTAPFRRVSETLHSVSQRARNRFGHAARTG